MYIEREHTTDRGAWSIFWGSTGLWTWEDQINELRSRWPPLLSTLSIITSYPALALTVWKWQFHLVFWRWDLRTLTDSDLRRSRKPNPPQSLFVVGRVQPKRHLDRFSRFCTAQGRRSLYFTMGRPFRLKITPFRGESGPPSNTWFPEPTRVHNPNGISIGSAVFAGLTTVTHRQTDRPRYLVGNNRPQLRT